MLLAVFLMVVWPRLPGLVVYKRACISLPSQLSLFFSYHPHNIALSSTQRHSYKHTTQTAAKSRFISAPPCVIGTVEFNHSISSRIEPVYCKMIERFIGPTPLDKNRVMESFKEISGVFFPISLAWCLLLGMPPFRRITISFHLNHLHPFDTQTSILSSLTEESRV
jgi:hypothetical protein